MRVASRTGPRQPGRVSAVEPGGLGAEVGVEPGDEIVAVNGRQPTDLLDFRFEESGERITLDFRKPDGSLVSVEVEKDEVETLGLDFDEDLFDGIRTCRNNCPFCFVYQNPRRLRKTLYIKDEDYRYSFLHGNYMTLSNLSEEDWDKIFKMRLSPLYVSVHSTEPELRKRLLGTRDERPITGHLRRLAEGGIDFYAQVVAIPGWNDGPELERTLDDLLGFHPAFRGLAVVPVGLTRHRDKLVPLPSYDREGALAMIAHGERLGKQTRARYGQRLIYLADEFYLMAGLPVPPMSYYEGYDLREDGIGMLRKFTQDFRRALPRFLKRPFKSPPVPTALATGRAAAGMFAEVVMPGLARKPGLEVQLVPVDNLFFGNTVTVAGLLTATDYRGALAGRSGFARVLLAAHSLRADGAVFLDDGTPEGLAAELGVELVPVPDSAQALLELLWGYPPPRRVKPAGPQAAEVAIYGC